VDTKRGGAAPPEDANGRGLFPDAAVMVMVLPAGPPGTAQASSGTTPGGSPVGVLTCTNRNDENYQQGGGGRRVLRKKLGGG
jgi:hypothetical protein